MVVYYQEAMCHAEKMVHYLECQGHSKGLYNQNMTFYCIFLAAGLFSNKLGVIVKHHQLGVSCGKMGLLHLRSRTQGRFKMSLNVCPDSLYSVFSGCPPRREARDVLCLSPVWNLRAVI